jgi:hypothetical protein
MSEQFDAINTVEDVQALIDNSVHESEVLGYKTASAPFDDKGRREVAKDVSAMANSLGGVIIYGVATNPTLKSKPVRIEDVDPKCFAALDQIVNSQVRPPVAFRKKLIPPGAPRVMVVDVPASEDPPHQSLYDKRYYRRSGEESIAMEHDLVAMHLGRRSGPVLAVKLETTGRIEKFHGDENMSNAVMLRILIENSGKRVAHHVLATFVFPPRELVMFKQQAGSLQPVDELYPGRQARQYSGALAVIHPMSTRRIGDIYLRFRQDVVEQSPEGVLMSWKVFADEMTAITGSASLRSLGLA